MMRLNAPAGQIVLINVNKQVFNQNKIPSDLNNKELVTKNEQVHLNENKQLEVEIKQKEEQYIYYKPNQNQTKTKTNESTSNLTSKQNHYDEPKLNLPIMQNISNQKSLYQSNNVSSFLKENNNQKNTSITWSNSSKTHQHEDYNKNQYDEPVLNMQMNSKRSSKPLIQANDNQKTINVQNKQLLDDNEINQIEFFYRSQKTYVFVSRSMANLYFTQTDLINNGRYSSPRAHEWTLSRTGVPLIVFNKGGIKSRLKRQLKLCLAERGSGFTLFSDVIDNLTDYKKMHDNFHTLYLSIDHRKMAGLSFDCSIAADEFLKQIELITSNPKNICLTGPKYNTKKMLQVKNQLKQENKQKKKKNNKKPKKSEISMPCLFQHVTCLNLSDFEKFYSLSTLVLKEYNERKNDYIKNQPSSQPTERESCQTDNLEFEKKNPQFNIENNSDKNSAKFVLNKNNEFNEKNSSYKKPNKCLPPPSSICSSSCSSTSSAPISPNLSSNEVQ